METTSQSAPLTNLQRELLKLFAQNVADEDLIAIRRLIARYFAEKAMDLADQAWEEKGWTDEDAIRLVHTKMRTPYNPSQE
ncbi:MAG: hypothetical protein H6557_05710 [Lewinellaceae bacterium]|nr:hypothetical protein [Phaeodactylibacter sp.]MCB9036101.1 hypothetical protein [Lewinellaceae bacterium]